MVLKITNLHILRYLPTCWLYLLERYTIDNQRCTHTASKKEKLAPEIAFFIKVFSFVFLYRKNALSLQKFSAEKRAKSDFPTI